MMRLRLALAALICVSSPAVADNLPGDYLGWYVPTNSASDHCDTPQNWDDNYRVTDRSIEFTDGRADFVSVKNGKLGDTITVQLIFHEPARTIRQTEIWHMETIRGDIFLTRTMTAFRASPQGNTPNLPAATTARQCPNAN